MYRDLAEAIESVKKNGYDRSFEIVNNELTTRKENEQFTSEEVSITATYHFDQGTSAGDDRSLFLIETDSGVKGYLVTGSTIYKDRSKAEFLDQILPEK
ncbi:MAG: hypothetical protein R3281_03480 [Balneolaceae bacterium]|nr:hypothetical protein [Balneolaceae bacterium]